MERPTGFYCKKYTIIVLTSISIFFTLIACIIICATAEKLAENAHDEDPKVDTKNAKVNNFLGQFSLILIFFIS